MTVVAGRHHVLYITSDWQYVSGPEAVAALALAWRTGGGLRKRPMNPRICLAALLSWTKAGKKRESGALLDALSSFPLRIFSLFPFTCREEMRGISHQGCPCVLMNDDPYNQLTTNKIGLDLLITQQIFRKNLKCIGSFFK